MKDFMSHCQKIFRRLLQRAEKLHRFPCVVQLLLQATPKKNRALIISIYTLFVTLSNSLLPFFGVSVYTALGANDTAIFTVNVIESAARFGVLIMMVLRYRMMKRRGDLFRPLCEE